MRTSGCLLLGALLCVAALASHLKSSPVNLPWCRKKQRQCVDGCEGCCELVQIYCEQFLKLHTTTISEGMTGRRTRAKEAMISEINEGISGEKAVQMLIKPVSIAGRQVRLFNESELRFVIEEKTKINKLLAGKCGYTDNAQMNAGNDSPYFAGDQLLSLEQVIKMKDALIAVAASNDGKSRIRTKRKLQSSIDYRWNPERIPYVFDDAAGHDSELVSMLRDGVEFWQSHTCLKFVESTCDCESENDYIVITKNGGCASYKGKIGGAQALHLGFGCERFGIVAHELGHVLGLWHEHQRYDRDTSVTIAYENIEANKIDNFYKCNETSQCIANDVPYDYGSIMHYYSKAFSNNGKETIVPKRPGGFNQTIGARRLGPSFYDVKQINMAYCNEICGSSSTECENGGYPNPKNCSLCLCPTGFYGNQCEHLSIGYPTRCGGRTVVAETWETLQTPRYPDYFPVSQECIWVLEGPPDRTIQFQFDGDTFGFVETEPCEWNFAELRLSSDLANTGIRLCGWTRPNETYVSQTNRMMVMLLAMDPEYSDEGFQGRYRLTPVATPIPPPPDCPRYYSRWQTDDTVPLPLCFRARHGSYDWGKGGRGCRRMGSTMPSFRTRDEMEAFINYAKLTLGLRYVYAGLKDANGDGLPYNELWHDGVEYKSDESVPLSRFRWRSGDGVPGGCAVINTAQRHMQFIDCNTKHAVVCQKRTV